MKPVAWFNPKADINDGPVFILAQYKLNAPWAFAQYTEPLYTRPEPLTDEQILSIVKAAPALDSAEAEWLHVARAIERALFEGK